VPAVLLSHERIDAILVPRVPRGAPLRMVADCWNRRLARVFPTIVCASRFAAREFTRVGATVDRVPLGVDLDLFHPDAAARPEADGGDADVRLVCVGRLSKEKRPDLALDALRLLVGAGVDARLWMVGDGPLRRSLERRARSDRLPVTFTGHVGERGAVAAHLARADVAVAPGPYETFGLSVLEALACGTPVVCADAGAAPELVAGGGDDPVGRAALADPVAIAAAVTAVLAWPAPARRAAARRRAESYPWSRTVGALLRIHRVA
jgi:alpha-1,6-mannosyltransferase